jgi:ribosomal protein S18 acetylase RimI-like enzyme
LCARRLALRLTEPTVEIVRLAPDDWPAYREIRLRALAEDPQAFGESYANAAALPDARWRRRLEEAQAGASRVLIFARRGERLVGVIAAVPYPTGGDAQPPATDDTREARIISVFVAPEERGRGTGARLMETILHDLMVTGRFDRVSLTVNRAQQAAVGLYCRFGFQVVGELDAVMGNGERHRELIMERPLQLTAS